MKLPSNYFDNLSATKYRQYLKLLPNMHSENTIMITTLIFTFAALSFFGIVAINPTLSTIVELKKQLADCLFVKEQLNKKIQNLSSLQDQYATLSPDFPYIFNALPPNAMTPTLTGQVEALTRAQNIKITNLRVYEVQIAGNKPNPIIGSSYLFSMEANGDYDNLMKFVSAVTQMNRLVTIESVSFSKDLKKNILVLNIRGKQYFY